MKKRQNRKHSLFMKICVPLAAVILIQTIFFFFATFYGGISETINQNARDVLTERVINREADIETKFTTQWTNFTLPQSRISDIYQRVKKESSQNVYENPTLQKEILKESNDILVNMLRANEVTGVFLIMNNQKDFQPLKTGTQQEKYGICIRDYSPSSEYKNREDLLMVRCPASMVSEVGCSVETWWDALFRFNDKVPGDYYFKPLEMAYEYPGTDNSNLAYFDGIHNFGNTDRMVVSYSIPLIDEDGYPYAVLGIELTADYLKTLLTASKLYGDNAGCFVMVQYEEGKTEYKTISYDGTLYQQCFGNVDQFSIDSKKEKWFENDEIGSKIPVCGSNSDMQIYNQNTPYEKQKVAIIGLVKRDSLYEINATVKEKLFIVSCIVMIFGIACVLIISKRLTDPINRLSKKAHKMDGNKEIQLDRLNIDEIDGLVQSIEELNDKVSRNAIRTEFFSRMSHDMRTPMNAIIGFSSSELQETANITEMREYMKKIHTSGNFLLTLINDVLDMTKIESQRMELREEVLTEKAILNSFVSIIREVAKEKKVDFSVISDDTETRFWGDKQRICQVLMNLLSNAVKFCKEDGHVTLQVKELHKDKDNVTHEVIVQDDGCGMSEAFQQKMYEPFAQEGKSDGGTGLGLAITYQIVNLMGGTIQCESQENHGTKFTIILSNKLAGEDSKIETLKEGKDIQKSEAGSRNEEGEESKKEKRLEGARILLCEDHPINIQVARKLLERVGIIVEEAHDGKEGLERFQNSEIGYYNIILMDIRMPNMNGIEAATAIRGLQREDAAKIPIIAMTANAFKEDVEETRKAGMNEHLSKPIDPKILYVTLEKYV